LFFDGQCSVGDSSFGAKMTFEQEQNQKAVKNPSNLTRRLKQVASKVTSGHMVSTGTRKPPDDKRFRIKGSPPASLDLFQTFWG
jgi:hypothetical protein